MGVFRMIHFNFCLLTCCTTLYFRFLHHINTGGLKQNDIGPSITTLCLLHIHGSQENKDITLAWMILKRCNMCLIYRCLFYRREFLPMSHPRALRLDLGVEIGSSKKRHFLPDLCHQR